VDQVCTIYRDNRGSECAGYTGTLYLVEAAGLGRSAPSVADP